jgi:hypothetical protein
MKRLLSFVSPWALAVIATWLVVMVVAYNWAIPIYANIGDPGLCGEPNCGSVGTFTPNVPMAINFAVIVATCFTVVLGGMVLIGRRVVRP